MRRSGPHRRRKWLERRAALRRSAPLRRKSPLRRSPFSPASQAQLDKVRALACLVCGARPVDPAHLVPRSLGGCDDADCVVPLCRSHHRMYDRGELDLLAVLEPRFRRELAHGLLHVGLLGLLRRVTATRWEPASAAADGSNRQELLRRAARLAARLSVSMLENVHALSGPLTRRPRLLFFFLPERARVVTTEPVTRV